MMLYYGFEEKAASLLIAITFTPMIFATISAEARVGLVVAVTHLIIRLDGELFHCHLLLETIDSFSVRCGLVWCKQRSPI